MIPKQLRQLPTPGRTGPTRLTPGATASWLRREAHVTVLVTPSGLPFAHGNRLKGSDVCQAGGSLVPARSASRGDGARGGTSAEMGGGVGRSQHGAGVPRERGQSPTARRLRARRPDTGPAGPPQRPLTRRGLGGGAASQSRAGTGRCLCPAATSLVPFSQLSHTALPARPGPRYTRGNGGRPVGSPPGHTRKRVP